MDIMRHRAHTAKGFTFIEILIAIAIGSVLIIAIAVFFGRGIVTYREQFERVLTTEDARIHIKRIADAIRNHRIESATDYSIVLAQEESSEGEIVRAVEYRIDAGTGQLIRTDDLGGEDETDVIIAETVRNREDDTPLFLFFNAAGELVDAEEATWGNVRRIELTLVVDRNRRQHPGATVVRTVITPREFLGGAANVNAFAMGIARLNFAPGNPPQHTGVEITVTDPVTSEEETQAMPLNVLNQQKRLQTYVGGPTEPMGYHAQPFYQMEEFAGHLPGWYVDIGPIMMWQGTNRSYDTTDRITFPDICLEEADLSVLLTTCENRQVSLTVNNFTYEKEYRPILMYSDGKGQYIVTEVEFSYTPEE